MSQIFETEVFGLPASSLKENQAAPASSKFLAELFGAPEASLKESQVQPGNSKFLGENCLAALMTMAVFKAPDNQDVSVRPADFDSQLGKETGDYLRKIGCRSVSMTGDKLELRLGGKYLEPVGQSGIKQARLSDNVSCNIRRNGGSIELSSIKGIDLDFGRFSPWVGLPDMNLSPGNLELVLPLKNINISVPRELYDNVSDLLARLKR